MVDAPPTESSAAPPLSDLRRNLILAAMCLALVMVVSGVSMLNNALPHLAESLGLSQSKQQWVIDAYTVVLAALLLPAGAIGDRFGRRGALVVGSVIFTIGSVAAALSGSANLVIGSRAFVGIGAALIMPATLSTITSVFPPEGRAKAVGIWAGFAMAGGTIGLFLSGLLVDRFYAGSVFVASAVLGLVVLAAVAAFVPSTRSSTHVGLDPLGAVLSVAGIGAVVLGIIEGPERGWTDPLALGALVGGVAFLAVFVGWEARAEHPLLDPRLFRIRGFATGSASMFLQFLAMFGFFFVGTQYLQLILGYGALTSAVALLPMTVAMLAVSPVAATLAERLGQKLIGAVGLAVSAVGFGILATVTAGSGYGLFAASSVVIGLGTALAMTPATNAIVSSLPAEKQGVASAVNDSARELGAAFGIAIVGSAFNIGYRHAIRSSLAGLSSGLAGQVSEAPATALQAAGRLGSSGRATLIEHTHAAFTVGLRDALLVGVIALTVGALYTWWRAPSAAEARAEDVLDGAEVDLSDGEPLDPDAEPVPVLAGRELTAVDR